jgi:ER membrane protein complex subunit 1
MRLQPLTWACACLFQSTSAIYSDDAFVVDYHHPLIGVPQSHATFFHRPQSSSNASLLYTLSDKHVLGAINPKDGNVLWRQRLAEADESSQQHSYAVAGEQDGQIVTGHGTAVSSWDALDGKLRWEYVAPTGYQVKGIQLLPSPDTISGQAQDVIAVSSREGGTTVTRLSGSDGAEVWSHSDSGADTGPSVSVAASLDAVYYIAKSSGLLSGSKAKVVVLDPATGKEKNQYSTHIDAESILGGDQLSLGTCTGHPFIVSSEKPYKTVKFNLLGNSKQTTLTIEDKAEDISTLSAKYACGPSAPAHFLIHVETPTKQWAEVYHIDLKSGEASKAYTLPATEESSAFAAQNVGSETYFVRTTPTEAILYSSVSHGELGRWRRVETSTDDASLSNILSHASAEVVSGKAGFSVRIAETTVDGIFALYRNGELQWARPEMLAYATIGSWVDETAQNALIDELETEAAVSPITAYIHRVKRHLHDLQGLPEYLKGIVEGIVSTPTSGVMDVRRRLVGEKMIVLGTSRNELIAVDASNAAAVAWQTNLAPRIARDVDFVHLSTSGGRVTAYLSDGSLVAVNATTGAFIEYLAGSIPAEKVLQIPGPAAPIIVKIDAEGMPHVATDFAPSNAVEGNVVVTLSETGSAIGWSIAKDPSRTWTLLPKAGEKFTSVVSRANEDAVASIGKVLGDRSVLYKYISPNLAVLTANSSNTFTIYLVEAVTGTVLFSSSHTGLLPSSSIPTLLTENWLAYTFTSVDPTTSGLTSQIIVAELYESASPNDRGALAAQGNYSSYAPDAGTRPHVITQSFTVAEPISNLAVTQTTQGITTRQLLVTLAHSNAIVAIPKEILNARRPVQRDPNANEKEEGLIRYNPVLELEPRNFLSHAREVLGINKVIATPSLLESTSLVFAFGHDIFGTQVNPSGAFDILGKGFNKVQLLLTIVALFGGVLLVRPLVRRKKVDGRWRG